MTLEHPLFMQGRTYSARLTRQLTNNLLTEGILGAGSFAVTQRGAGANVSVDVAAGVAVVTGDDQSNQGRYLLVSTATENIAVTAAPGSNSRIDIVVLQVKDPNAGGAAGDNFVPVVIAGTPSATPSAPATPASALLLATITVSSSTPSITNALITDARTTSRLAHELVNTATLADGSVTTAKILDANVTEAKMATAVLSSAATPVTFATGWAAPGGGGGLALRYKKIGNVVFVTGNANRTGSSTSNSTICTLPVGFRPSDMCFLAIADFNGNAVMVRMNADGTLVLPSVTTGVIYGFACSFVAA